MTPWQNPPPCKQCENLRAEVERLREALQRIVDEADSDSGLTAWDGSDIARAALSARNNEGRAAFKEERDG